MNQLKQRLLRGEACVNGWSTIPSGFAAELMAQAGWDSLTVDMQHGVHDYRSMVECFQAIGGYPITPLVRVPWNEPGIIGRALDGGAWGIICPMISNATEARALVASCLYLPAGRRSFGPVRSASYGQATSYLKIANEEVLILPMIETQEAVENVGEILDVPGISGLYIGPSDLAISLGVAPALDTEDPTMLGVYRTLLREAAARGKIAGIHNLSPTYASRMVEMGFRFVTVGNDSRMVAGTARETVQATRDLLGRVKALSA